jgi:omega-6 fatty acid desaturase (delta-12 desaturase)
MVEENHHSSSDAEHDKQLFKATLPYGVESLSSSWWVVGSTFLLLIASLLGAALAPAWPIRLFFSLLSAMLLVRTFITYHDYMHNAILTRSRLAWWLFRLYSAFALTPPRSWRRSHNFHHGHVGKIDAASTGAFATMTTEMWRKASFAQRIAYRVERHPLTIVAGYFTIFFLSVTLMPFLRKPLEHWDSLLVLLGHITLITLLWILGGFDTAFFVVLLPMTIASMIGSFLFFAQHSFEEMRVLPSETWTSRRAAIESSSYLKLNKVMRWFTGNIGYHHVHHLNVRIPFYRLPEVMEAIPGLQSPATITLSLRDIKKCFRCCLWDEQLQRMVSYREFAAASY